MSTLATASAARPRVEAVEAASAGFRLMRREPRTWLAWAAISLVFYVGVGVASFAAMGPQMAALSAGAPRDPTAMFAALAHAAPAYALIALLSFALYAVFYAGVNRALLRPQERAWRHLRLGADELRQFAVFLLLSLVLLAFYIVSVIVIAVFIGLGGVLAAAAGGGGGGAKVGAALVVGLLTLVAIVAELAGLAWIGVRLSLASPLTFDTGRVRLFGSWKLTRGVFWPLFGAYLLTLVFLALVAIGPLFVSGVIAAMTGGAGGVGGFLLRPDMTSAAAYFGPARIVSFVLGAAVFPLYLALLVGAPASAYAQIVGSGGYVAGSRVADARAQVFGPAA